MAVQNQNMQHNWLSQLKNVRKILILQAVLQLCL